jgi:hypothetical protein
MDLPNKTLLEKISKSHCYYDKKSKNKNYPFEEKPKYKLAGKPFLNNYFFHILTTNKGACSKRVTLVIKKGDWIERASVRYLQEEVSYCDLESYEILIGNQLLKKMRDKKNGFFFAAKLCPSMCGKM